MPVFSFGFSHPDQSGGHSRAYIVVSLKGFRGRDWAAKILSTNGMTGLEVEFVATALR